MAESITIKALQDASLDAKSLEEVVNGNDAKQVTTRLGETYPSVKKAIKALFENGGLPAVPFATKALMTASALVDGEYAQVTDDTVNNGLYVKTAGTWVKSSYDPLVQANAYADEKVKDSLSATVDIVSDTLGEYVKKSDNLLSLTEIEEGYTILPSGVKEVNSSFGIHPFIQVTPNEKYLLSSENRYAVRAFIFYDYKKDFMHRSDVFFDEGNKSRVITIPAGAVYIKPIVTLVVYRSSDQPMLVKGETPIPYEPKKAAELVNVVIGEDVLPVKKLEAIAEDKIQDFSDTFLEPSANLLSLTGLDANKTINEITGVPETNSSYSIHPFIAIKPSSQYTLSATSLYSVRWMAYYNKDKEFLGRVDTTLGEGNVLVITTPSNAYYARPVVTTSYFSSTRKPMMVKGSTQVPYEPKTDPSLINVKLDNVLSVGKIESIAGGEISGFSDTFLEPTYNLLRFGNITENKTINPTTGDLDDHGVYGVHPYIRVEPNTDYTLSSGNVYSTPWMAYYDKDRKFLGRADTALGEDNTLLVTTTEDTHYVRFVVNGTRYSKRYEPMFEKGVTKSPYVLGQDFLKNVAFADDVKDELRDVIKPYKYDLPVGNVFNAPSGYTQYSDVDRDMPNADVYAKWDALVAAHPDYISKQYLGLSTGDHEVSCYKLKAQRFTNSLSSPVDTGFTDKYPTIFLTCGTHGQEPNSVFTSYALAHQLCTNWQSDEALELLRYNVDILIIPISNPSARVVRSRPSASGVDIGRNFPCSTWEQYAGDPEARTYAGPYPASEPETRYIMQIFEENDVDIYYDFHNFAASELGRDHFIWVLVNGVTQLRMERTSRLLFGRMSRKWHKDFEWIPENWDSGYSEVVTGGLPYNYAAEIVKVPLCGTLEFSLTIPLQTPAGSRFDETHSKMLVEGLVNWLLINLQEINGG